MTLCISSLMLTIVGAADKSLILYLPLNEGQGSTAMDASSYQNPGDIVGAAAWVQGRIGMALEIVANSHVVLPEIPEYDVTSEVTLMTWMKTTSVTTWARLIDKSQWQTSGYDLVLNQNTQVPMLEFFVNNTTSQVMATTPADDNEWHFIAGTFGNQTLRIYVDGIQEGEVGSNGGVDINPNNLPVMIGGESSSNGGNQYFGIVDEVAMFNRELTADEIQNIFENGMTLPELASDPQPQDEETDVPRDVVLRWAPGEFAPAVNGHVVYLSEIFDDVNDGIGGIGGITQSADSYAPPQRLDFGTTYHWRIDEVNAPPDSTVYPGEVWSFTTEPVAYPIDGANINATASSVSQAGVGPENTINGSGLDDNDLHSAEPTDMWLSGSEPLGAWAQYEFDGIYKLHEMWVWNSNQMFEASFLGFGLRDVAVEYSTDGVDWTALVGTPEFAQAPGGDGYAHNTTVDFGGVVAKYVKLTATSNWAGLLPQYGLSEVRFFYVPVNPREPSPDSGATDVGVDATLGFRAGREAAKHDVYLSTDEQAVIDGTVPVTSVTEPSYAPSLDLASTYYWRIDEVNDTESPTTWQGDIWNLSTQEYLIVEDFESYNDIPAAEEGSNLVYATWADGFENPANGSTMGYTAAFQPSMETSLVHDGRQSVPLFYDNTTAAYSEVTANVADLQAGQDWTRHGIKALTLRFSGDPTNVVQQMYVKINGAKVAYDGSSDDTRLTAWQMWYVDLASIGVSASNVTDLAIGFERIGTLGGQGVVFLDGIRLYSHDRQLITPADPGTADLQAHYEFEGNTNDSSGNARNGTEVGSPFFEAGKVGQAISLNGLGDYVEIAGYKGVLGSSAVTVTAWVRTTSTGTTDGGSDSTNAIVGWGSGGASERFGFRIDDGRLRIEHAGGNIQGQSNMADGQWHHVAVTVQENSTISYPQVILYLDGNDDTRPTTDPDPFNITAAGDVRIGSRPAGSDRFFSGQIDDLRIYGRALSPDEIAGSAGRTKPFDYPF